MLIMGSVRVLSAPCIVAMSSYSTCKIQTAPCQTKLNKNKKAFLSLVPIVWFANKCIGEHL